MNRFFFLCLLWSLIALHTITLTGCAASQPPPAEPKKPFLETVVQEKIVRLRESPETLVLRLRFDGGDMSDSRTSVVLTSDPNPDKGEFTDSKSCPAACEFQSKGLLVRVHTWRMNDPLEITHEVYKVTLHECTFKYRQLARDRKDVLSELVCKFSY